MRERTSPLSLSEGTVYRRLIPAPSAHSALELNADLATEHARIRASSEGPVAQT